MKSETIRHNSLDWRIAFDLGYWRAVYLADRRTYPASSEMHACARHRSEAVAGIAREAVKHMSRARRRAFGATINSALNSTLAWKGQLRAA